MLYLQPRKRVSLTPLKLHRRENRRKKKKKAPSQDDPEVYVIKTAKEKYKWWRKMGTICLTLLESPLITIFAAAISLIEIVSLSLLIYNLNENLKRQCLLLISYYLTTTNDIDI